MGAARRQRAGEQHTPTADAPHAQLAHTVRIEWGLTGAQELLHAARRCGESVIAVVVDVLSFTTAVSVCLEQGAVVHPYRWADDSAAEFARRLGAQLAVGRSQVPDLGPVSLSPASLRDGLRAHRIEQVVLPSPNGSTISTALADAGGLVLAGSLRNATALARHVTRAMREHAAHGRRVSVVVIPSGERWPDQSLRPAIEDLWGAGAVIGAIANELEHQAGPALLSPESTLAAEAFAVVRHDLSAALTGCASGIELGQRGYGTDVAIAAEHDATQLVPVLADGRFVPAGRLP